MDINIYKFDKDLQIVELGKGNIDKVNELLEESLSSSNKTYEHGEDAIAATSFGISKINKDFIEIGCHGDNEITIHTDRLFYGSKWSKIFSLKQHLFIKANKNEITSIIKNYIESDRESFEVRHQKHLCR